MGDGTCGLDSAAICKNCGHPILSIDGWVHADTGSRRCAVQPPPLVAEPDEDACA